MSILRYRIQEISFREDTLNAVKRVFNTDLGTASVYPVFVTFKTRDGWTRAFKMIYDTGSELSLLPYSFYKALQLDKYAPSEVEGVTGDKLPVRIVKLTLKFVDMNSNTSPEIESWFCIAERDDVLCLIGVKDINMTHKFLVDAKSGIFTLEF